MCHSYWMLLFYNSLYFYARQLYRQVLLTARISYGNSVCPSVLVTRITPRWDRDYGFSPYGHLGSLVSNDIICCRWVRRFPSNDGIKERCPPSEIVILPLLAHLAWKRLQIDTDLQLIITSTADELSGSTSIDDLERPWNQNRVFVIFFAICGCHIHYFRVNCVQINGDRPNEIFSISRRF